MSSENHRSKKNSTRRRPSRNQQQNQHDEKENSLSAAARNILKEQREIEEQGEYTREQIKRFPVLFSRLTMEEWYDPRLSPHGRTSPLVFLLMSSQLLEDDLIPFLRKIDPNRPVSFDGRLCALLTLPIGYNLLEALFQAGADPNLPAYPQDPEHSETVTDVFFHKVLSDAHLLMYHRNLPSLVILYLRHGARITPIHVRNLLDTIIHGRYPENGILLEYLSWIMMYILQHVPGMETMKLPRESFCSPLLAEGVCDEDVLYPSDLFARLLKIPHPPILVRLLTTILDQQIPFSTDTSYANTMTCFGRFVEVMILYGSPDALIRGYDLWKPDLTFHTDTIQSVLMQDHLPDAFLDHVFTVDPTVVLRPYRSSGEIYFLLLVMYGQYDRIGKLLPHFPAEAFTRTYTFHYPSFGKHAPVNLLGMLFSDLRNTTFVAGPRMEEILHLADRLIDAGSTANTCTVYQYGLFTTTLLSVIFHSTLFAQNEAHRVLIKAFYQRVLEHPSTDINYVDADGYTVMTTVLNHSPTMWEDMRVLRQRGAQLTLRDRYGQCLLLQLLWKFPYSPSLRMKDYIELFGPGEALYRRTDKDVIDSLTMVYVLFFGDSITVRPDTKKNFYEAFDYDLQQLQTMKQYHVFTEDEWEQLRQAMIPAFPHGEDFFNEDGALFHPHHHPLTTERFKTTGGITANGLYKYIIYSGPLRRMTDQKKEEGIPCYLGDECPSATKSITLFELSAMLPSKFWNVWKPALEENREPILRGMREIIGEHMYNTVIVNHRSTDRTYGEVYGNTICPFCMQPLNREMGCSYMKHSHGRTDGSIAHTPYCRADLCVKELIEPFYQAAIVMRRKLAEEEGIEFNPSTVSLEVCVQCGAPCVNHHHVQRNADGSLTQLHNKMVFQPALGEEVIDYGTCSGGGRRELIARALGAMEAYATMPPTGRTPAQERKTCAVAAEAAAHDPRFLEKAAEYLDMMAPYEALAKPLEQAKDERERMRSDRALAASHHRLEEVAAIDARIQEQSAKIDEMQVELDRLANTMTLKMDLPQDVTYDNANYRRWEEREAKRKAGITETEKKTNVLQETVLAMAKESIREAEQKRAELVASGANAAAIKEIDMVLMGLRGEIQSFASAFQDDHANQAQEDQGDEKNQGHAQEDQGDEKNQEDQRQEGGRRSTQIRRRFRRRTHRHRLRRTQKRRPHRMPWRSR